VWEGEEEQAVQDQGWKVEGRWSRHLPKHRSSLIFDHIIFYDEFPGDAKLAISRFNRLELVPQFELSVSQANFNLKKKKRKREEDEKEEEKIEKQKPAQISISQITPIIPNNDNKDKDNNEEDKVDQEEIDKVEDFLSFLENT